MSQATGFAFYLEGKSLRDLVATVSGDSAVDFLTRSGRRVGRLDSGSPARLAVSASGTQIFAFDGWIDWSSSRTVSVLGAAAHGLPVLLEKPSPDGTYGQWSWIWLDLGSGTLEIAREPIGARTVYYAATAAGFAVASNVQSIRSSILGERRANLEAMPEYFALGGTCCSGLTPLRNLHELAAGHTVQLAPQAQAERRFWHPPEIDATPNGGGDLEACLVDLLGRSVDSAMCDLSTAMVDVSGGLDSSTIAGLVARSTTVPSRVVAFSMLASGTPSFDESRYQSMVLGGSSWEHCVFDLDSELPDEPGVPPVTPLPSFETIWHRPLRAMRRVVARMNASARITGYGGDSIFCGRFPPLDLADSLRAFRVEEWFSLFVAYLNIRERSAWNLLSQCSLGNISRPGCSVKLATPRWIRSPTRDKIREVHYAFPAKRRTFRSPGQELHLRTILRQPIGIRETWLHEDERHPMLVKEVVEFMLALPWTAKIGPGVDRVIQRNAMLSVVPQAVLNRADKGAGSTALHNEVRAQWPTLLGYAKGSRMADLGLVEPKEFEAAAWRFRHGVSVEDGALVTAALALEAWLERL